MKRALSLSAFAALVALVVAGVASSSSTPQPTAVGTPPHIFGARVNLSTNSSTAAAPCPLDAGGGLFIACYGPKELGQAYNFPSNLDGRGQTIVIVDAYGSPDIQQDLANFDQVFNLPAPPSFTVINARGTGATDGSGALSDWQSETTLDVEYAHAMAPGAKIVLGVAATDDNNDINAALAQVLPRYPGAIVSQSFGQDENAPGTARSNLVEHLIYVGATVFGDSLLASAGDLGASDGNTPPVPVAAYPASDPLVLAVGGTEGSPYQQPYNGGVILGAGLLSHNRYGAEQVWNETECCSTPVATGGAPSLIFPRPPWQTGFTSSKGRIVPDVSYNASVLGGVVIVTSCYTPDVPDGCDPTDPFFSLIGGTSAGSPQWAAIIAIANQARGMRGERNLGLVAPALYAIAKSPHNYSQDFHDITTGNNILGSGNDPGADPSQGFFAGSGFDDATGLGTPNVGNLVSDLVAVGPFDNPGLPNPGSLGHTGRSDRWHQQHPHTAEPGA
ncbi:MAG TPA: S53 family peptidase [Gaiellaceae bacterium]|jgi:subtilase family serine protease